ncbi:hypothetical protein RJ641_013852, partial [Dillenia turbinata]
SPSPRNSISRNGSLSIMNKSTSRTMTVRSCSENPLIGNQVGERLSLGMDFGTSGAGYTLIDKEMTIHAEGKRDYPRYKLSSIYCFHCHGWSSATTLIIDSATGEPLCRLYLYNESCSDALPLVKSISPPNHAVCSASTLCELVSWWNSYDSGKESVVLMHQADWLLWLLHGKIGVDYKKALKLHGVSSYAIICHFYKFSLLFKQAGTSIGTVKEVIKEYGFPKDCVGWTGTTDGMAAFLAACATKPGQVVRFHALPFNHAYIALKARICQTITL